MLAFSTTPHTHIRKYFVKGYKNNFCAYCSFKAVKKQCKGLSENLCFLYKHAKLYFFMSSSMDLLGPLTAMERFIFSIFLDNKIGTNYFELIEFMN